MANCCLIWQFDSVLEMRAATTAKQTNRQIGKLMTGRAYWIELLGVINRQMIGMVNTCCCCQQQELSWPMRRIPNKIVGDADPEANVISCKTSSQIFTAAAAKEGINKIIKQSKRHTHTSTVWNAISREFFGVGAHQSAEAAPKEHGPRTKEQGAGTHAAYELFMARFIWVLRLLKCEIERIARCDRHQFQLGINWKVQYKNRGNIFNVNERKP